MKFHRLKTCPEAFNIYDHEKAAGEPWEISESLRSDLMLSEMGVDFSPKIGMKFKIKKNEFHGFYGTFGNKKEASSLIRVSGVSTNIFVINADPNSDSFGSHDRCAVWNGNAIFVPPRFLFGFFTTKAEHSLVEVLFDGIITQSDIMIMPPYELQVKHHIFDGFDFGRLKLYEVDSTIEFDRETIAELFGNAPNI